MISEGLNVLLCHPFYLIHTESIMQIKTINKIYKLHLVKKRMKYNTSPAEPMESQWVLTSKIIHYCKSLLFYLFPTSFHSFFHHFESLLHTEILYKHGLISSVKKKKEGIDTQLSSTACLYFISVL